MTETNDSFRVVLRGYDPAEVDRRLRELMAESVDLNAQVETLSFKVRELEELLADHERAIPPTFVGLGDRIGQILQLAEDESSEMRRKAKETLDADRKAFADSVDQVQAEADRYAEVTRSEADIDAARTRESASRQADELREEAERESANRIQEAEAIFEESRAKASKAAADFEATLAERRAAAEAEFAEHMSEVNRRLEEADTLVVEARAKADQVSHDATRNARQVLHRRSIQRQVKESESQPHLHRRIAEAGHCCPDLFIEVRRQRNDHIRGLASVDHRAESRKLPEQLPFEALCGRVIHKTRKGKV